MPYIKRISSRIAGADNGSGGSKKAGLVYGSDWRRIPRSVLMTGTTNTILDCMLQNCRRVRTDSGVQTVYMPFTSTYVNRRARNNTVK
jgi:hypothetical protein